MTVATLQLDEVQATLLMPLWARAMEARRPDAILRDDAAVAIVDELPFDFGMLARKQVPVADYCIRSALIDGLVRDEMRARPAAPVVEFGAGLDTRFDRLGDGRRWIEFDFPEVIALRRRYFAERGERTMVAGRLPDCGWLDALEGMGGEPPIFVAEGVLYFLTAAEVRRLFISLAGRFPGAAFVFDAQSPVFLAFSRFMHPLRSRQSPLKFAVGRHAADIAAWDRRFRVERYVGFGDRPEYTPFLRRLSLFKRSVAALHPLTRHTFKVVLLRLGQEAAP